jgi:Tfp pilus assembly PilM family ATPase
MSKIFTAVIIDYNYIEIIEATKKNKTYIINNFSLEKLKQNDIDPTYNDNSGNAENILIAEEIKKAFGLRQFSKKNVFTVLNDDYIYNYNFSLPEMPEYDLAKAVEYEVKKKSQFPLSQIIYDYIYTYQENKDGSYTLLTTAYVTKKEYPEQLVKMFANADIKLRSIESKTTSLYNAYLFIHGDNANLLHYLVIDINLISIKIIIIYKNTIIFERNIEEINIIKNFKKINEAGETISAEIQKTVDYYYAGKSIEPIEKIYLSGVYANNEMFKDIISSLTNMHVETMSISKLLDSGNRTGKHNYNVGNNSDEADTADNNNDNNIEKNKNKKEHKIPPLIKLSSKLYKKIYKNKTAAKDIGKSNNGCQISSGNNNKNNDYNNNKKNIINNYIDDNGTDNNNKITNIDSDGIMLSNYILYDENNLFDILDIMLPAFGLILGK